MKALGKDTVTDSTQAEDEPEEEAPDMGGLPPELQKLNKDSKAKKPEKKAAKKEEAPPAALE